MDELGSGEVEKRTLAAALRGLDALQAQVEQLQQEAGASHGAWKRWLAAGGTASVTLLAFLVPSIQEQWDRMKQTAAVEEYRGVARELMRDAHYHEAEQVLAQAVDLASELRPDLERERLTAKTEQVNADPNWSGKIHPDLSEGDFVVLEGMTAHAHDLRGQSWAINNHAVFLANRGQLQRALQLAQQATRVQPADSRLRVTLGNILWDLGELDAAKRAYGVALQRDPRSVQAHYNLGLLYESTGNPVAAAQELRRVLALHPDDQASEDLDRIEAKLRDQTPLGTASASSHA
jgi:tetratricopeptide (TPR) repeat protein